MIPSSAPKPSTMPQFQSLEEALKQFFGYDNFRLGQRQIIEEALQDRDLLIIMPTGGGKSLCFQLPALLKPGLTVVVSPLIALMQDQVDALQDNGIGATFLNSSLSWEDVRSREAAILKGKIKLLYVAPERLLGEKISAISGAGAIANWDFCLCQSMRHTAFLSGDTTSAQNIGR
jgi:ATP-dependent DNA helicase RecQ